MKRIWLVLLTLGLVTAFSMQSMAVDVKFSGSYYAAGMYQDKTTLMKEVGEGPSTAFYYQRLRVRTEFIVSPGLKLVTRFDALERAWGAARSTPGTTPAIDSAGTSAENENIAFDLAYLRYESPIGDFNIGFVQKGGWGTDFGNNLVYRGALFWGKYFPKAGLYIWAEVAQLNDNSYTAKNATTYSDRDNVEYMVGINYYGIKNVEIGVMYDYSRFASGRNYFAAWKPAFDYGYITAAHLLEPYIKAKFGPVSLEAEAHYAFGDWIKFDGNHTGYSDMKLDNLQAYIKAMVDFGPVYAGGIFAYCAGDDPGTADKMEGGYVNGGRDFNPTLIMFNTERSDWAGKIPGHNAGVSPVNPEYYAYGNVEGIMQNAWFFQFYAGMKPVEKLDIMASLSYANADKKPTAAWLYNDYGYEVDLTATYKITNNLTYMLGGGYLFTGKFFKGTAESNQTNNDFLLINKLTLTF